MAVLIGSARIDENGNAHGGAAGDQTGKEVSTQNWYKHTKGWRVFRAKDAGKAAKIGQAMKAACANKAIGYDQYQRGTLYTCAEKVGFDISKVTTPCETDCSALVRVCCAYAGIMLKDFNTASQASVLLSSGEFIELTGSKYTAKPDYLRAGDILVTKTKGHTVVVLTDGSASEEHDLGSRTLRNGMSGGDVRELQEALIQLGYSCGPDGADGDFGGNTEKALRQFQKAHNLSVDGQYGSKSHAAMLQAIAGLDTGNNKPTDTKDTVVITGGSVNVRKGPGTSYGVLKIVHAGDRLEKVDASGWVCIKYNNSVCWASDKYVKDGKCTATSQNIRKEPNTSGSIVGVVKTGYKFAILDTNGWAPVKINNGIYFVSAKYVE